MIAEIRAQHQKLQKARAGVSCMENHLMTLMGRYLKNHPDGVRGVARALGVSPGYVCDLKYRRRKVSGYLIKKLERLEARP